MFVHETYISCFPRLSNLIRKIFESTKKWCRFKEKSEIFCFGDERECAELLSLSLGRIIPQELLQFK